MRIYSPNSLNRKEGTQTTNRKLTSIQLNKLKVNNEQVNQSTKPSSFLILFTDLHQNRAELHKSNNENLQSKN